MESYSSISIEELLHRCAVEGDADAWNEFVRRSQRIIATVVIRKAAQWAMHRGKLPMTWCRKPT